MNLQAFLPAVRPALCSRRRDTEPRQLIQALSPSAVRGVTLVELMIALAVAAIVLAAAVPVFTSVINNNRLTSQANELVAAVQFARSEAIRLNAEVSFCRSTNGSACATTLGQWDQWLVVANGAVLRQGAVAQPVQISSDQVRIAFFADGLARSAMDGALVAMTMVVCQATDKPKQNQRELQLVAGSRLSISSKDGSGVCP